MFLSLFPHFKKIKEENEMLRKENQSLKEEVVFYKHWFSGRHAHSEDIERAEQFFIKVFNKLHLHVSSVAFTTSYLKDVNENTLPTIIPGTTTSEDIKIWCLQAARMKYGEDADKAVEYAQKLFNYISEL